MTVSGLITTKMKNMNMNGDAAADMHAVVENFIIGVVKDLVCMSEKDDGGAEQLSWHGTKSDLLELLRVAYDSGEVMTADGVQMAFSAQLSAQVSAGVVAGSIGKYVLVVLAGNVIQFFIVLPLFLLALGLNPVHVLGKMMPAVLMALFTKSSAATLPVTMESAENRLGVRKDIARFVLPICTTINMNGCAAFILVTSLFVMQNGGEVLDLTTILLWILISVISAIGNAGVPMGCFFLTLSLMSGIGAPVAILGVILPIYTIIDMMETAENVWSDSCVCAMTNHDLKTQE